MTKNGNKVNYQKRKQVHVSFPEYSLEYFKLEIADKNGLTVQAQLNVLMAEKISEHKKLNGSI